VTGTGNNGDKRDGSNPDLGALDALGDSSSQLALRLLLEKTPVVLWAVDRELRLTVTAGAGLVAVGLRPGDGVGFSLYEHLGQHDETFPPIAAHLSALRGEASDFEHEWRGRLMAVRVAPLGAPGRAIEGVIGLAYDVTEQREAERTLRRREVELREARRPETVLRGLRPRVGELEDVLLTIHTAGERLGAKPGGAALEDLDQIRRASAHGVDVVRAMSEAFASNTEREAAGKVVEVDRNGGGGETILLVDDEPQVRGFVRRALEDQGYRVLEAGTVDEALSIGAAFEGRIHLLLTDVVLPGQNGPHLAARLAPVRPEMRILYMTGYADDAIVDRGVLSAGQSLLVKPFTSLGLAHGVKKALRT
jgi:CheY-like chemotaxis protein